MNNVSGHILQDRYFTSAFVFFQIYKYTKNTQNVAKFVHKHWRKVFLAKMVLSLFMRFYRVNFFLKNKDIWQMTTRLQGSYSWIYACIHCINRFWLLQYQFIQSGPILWHWLLEENFSLKQQHQSSIPGRPHCKSIITIYLCLRPRMSK